MSETTQTPTRDQIIASATSEADLMLKAAANDPALSAAIMRAQSASLTPIGSVVAMLATYILAHWGASQDPNLVAVLSGAATLAGGYAVHWFQGRFSTAKVTATIKPTTV